MTQLKKKCHFFAVSYTLPGKLHGSTMSCYISFILQQPDEVCMSVEVPFLHLSGFLSKSNLGLMKTGGVRHTLKTEWNGHVPGIARDFSSLDAQFQFDMI